ncbi:hypothetical protein FW774_17915 [Pedobacter sp. BS3]|uniref:right-handed parallel beta-helix repeat-containing protein n=1 Tax=Pedobacter sp. BS3 TaxID=2567937 RepID=UPI0011ECECB1|nr:right-handed parallel beta-helix repeat-containing protein [Pedobacter sp. BS3]TZF81440.1 hypothetical protein FW774_17915 [Pedobacter sp. BS3]
MKRLCLWLSLLIPYMGYGQLVRYVAPATLGSGNGLSAINAADFLNAAFWSDVQLLLRHDDVTVNFLAGDYRRAYTETPLVLESMGNGQHALLLQGDGTNTIFTIPTGYATQPVMVDIRNSRNITVRNFNFTGNGGINYVLRITTSGSTGNFTKNILIEACTWTDVRGIVYGATGCSYGGTSYVTYKNCTFKRIGLNSGSHMIYNAYDCHHISIIDCHFEDCTGDYVRFRDNCDYGVVKGSTFIRNSGFPDYYFINMPLFNDVDPGDETFATHYAFTGNSFGNISYPIGFLSQGFDPVGCNYLLTAAEGAVLTSGTTVQKKSLLLGNFKINTDEVRIYNNTFGSLTYKVTMSSKTAYGAVSKGWTGIGDITATVNTSATPLSWELTSNTTPGTWKNENTSLAYNLGAGTGNMGKVFTGTPPLTVGINSTSTQSSPGFLPYIPTVDGGGVTRVGYPSSNAIFTLQDADPGYSTLKINASGSGNPAKFSMYDINGTSAVASLFFTIEFNDSTSTRAIWTAILGNNSTPGSAGMFSNASTLTATGNTSNPEIFNAFRWEIKTSNPSRISFQYRKKTEETGNASYTEINNTFFKRGQLYNIEIYCNNSAVDHIYVRDGIEYIVTPRTYDIWADGVKLNTTGLPANQLTTGTVINSFMLHGTNSETNVIQDNSATATLGSIRMGFASAALPVSLVSFEGILSDKGIRLNWVTVSEQNNLRFNILQSTDGAVFNKIGNVTGAGNSDKRHNYSFIDDNYVQGVNYYRLQQVDMDGTTTFTGKIIAINAGLKHNGFNIYATVDNHLIATIYADGIMSGQIFIYDIMGCKLAEANISLNRGQTTVTLPANLNSGIYIASLIAGNRKQSVRFFK